VPDDPDPIPVDEEGFQPADAPPRPPPDWGTENRRDRLARLLREARDLPSVPGVYLMKDHKGVTLYVGKASKLCDRVASYFLKSTDLGPKKTPMLDEVHTFETILCKASWEATMSVPPCSALGALAPWRLGVRCASASGTGGASP